MVSFPSSQMWTYRQGISWCHFTGSFVMIVSLDDNGRNPPAEERHHEMPCQYVHICEDGHDTMISFHPDEVLMTQGVRHGVT